MATIERRQTKHILHCNNKGKLKQRKKARNNQRKIYDRNVPLNLNAAETFWNTAKDQEK